MNILRAPILTTSFQRISELLVSLVTGSINDIDRVGINVPENDLDRIKETSYYLMAIKLALFIRA